MTARTSSSKTTKELILDAAFSFYKKPRYNAFSMSELAAKVGISKPAIYRHYKDKDAVLAAMYEHFVSALTDYLLNVQAVEQKGVMPVEPVANIIQFFADHPSYVDYMMGNLSSQKNFEFTLIKDLEKRGVTIMSGFQFSSDSGESIVIKDFERYVNSIYCGVTIFIFIKGREKRLAGGEKPQSTQEFAEKLVLFLVNGLAGTTDKSDILYPQKISEERMANLDKLCTITPDMLPAENRFFTAFASVIRKYKFNGVTVERIADELGMAKSSLYEYFDNKNEMIRSLIIKELTLLDMISKENIIEAQTFSEYLYVLMRSVFSFFQLRSSIIPICGWLLMDSTEGGFLKEFEGSDVWRDRLPVSFERPAFGMPLHSKEFISWVSCLPVSLVMQCAGHKMTDDMLLSALKKMFDFVQYGIGKK
ncbi:MAG: TetR/AcrR family transcriptional regulator [Treponema sp.]|nr:TetR/AcrR family transcriptional regulator [Treponema sp.]